MNMDTKHANLNIFCDWLFFKKKSAVLFKKEKKKKGKLCRFSCSHILYSAA